MSDHRFQTGALILDRYRVQGVLGAGGVGVVYDTVDDRLGRPVAVKVLRRSAQDHRTAAKRTVREARALGSLSHPHLVTLLDFDYLDDGCPVLVMERVGGESAQALLRREGSLSVAAVIDILRQSLDALDELHAAGIIHRDLKPGNILIEQPEANSYRVKLIDFGIVQLVADEAATALTLSGEVFGSPRYMSPEQWTQKPVDARTDLYALGMIGHVMLAGEHFIQVRNPVQVFEAHLSPHRPRLTVTRTGEVVPPALADALHRAMLPDPAQRFESALDMRRALEPLLTASGHFKVGPHWLDDEEETTVAPPPDPDATLMDPGALRKALLHATGDGFPTLSVAPAPPAPAPQGIRSSGDQRLAIAAGDERTGVTHGDFERALSESKLPSPRAPMMPTPAGPIPGLAPIPSVVVADRPTVPQQGPPSGLDASTPVVTAPAPRGLWARWLAWLRRALGRG